MMTEGQEAHIRHRMNRSSCDCAAMERWALFVLESSVLTLEDSSALRSRKVSGAVQINLTYIQIKQDFFFPQNFLLLYQCVNFKWV